MWKPDADPIYVRASAWSKCDLLCSYCPIEEGMENRVPERLAGRRLSTQDYIRNMAAVSRAGLRGISFTGGEPTLRPDLGALIRGVRPFFDRVDLTTNGVRLDRIATVVREHVNHLKVSLDSVDPAAVASITGRAHAYAAATNAIEWAIREAVPLGINAVVMKSTLSGLPDTIRYVRQKTARATAPVHLSLLDLYYTPSRRAKWLAEFVPTSVLLELLSNSFGPPSMQERFGCQFYWFDTDGLRVRVKDSFGATMRAPKCAGCASFCQEGVFGVKHSVEGWFTTCPGGREDLGAHLEAGLDHEVLDGRIRSVAHHVQVAAPDETSFQTMCRTHFLRPPIHGVQHVPFTDATRDE